jgi:hypothetical protein
MSDFADVERFAREHAACGGLTPSAMPRPGGGGYLLTLSCACGATFDRWVSPEEARRPLPIPARAAPAPAAPAAPAPASAGAAPPAPPPAAVPRPPVSSKPKPRPSQELEALVREALEAEEAPVAPAAPATPAAPAPPPAPGPVSPAGPGTRSRVQPERLNLDTTIRSALQHQAEMTLPPPPRARRGSRGRLVWLVLFMVVGLGAAGVIFVAGGPDGPLPMMTSTPPPRASDPQRAALEGVVKSLRELHSVATSTTSVSVYSTRVTGAKTEAERYLTASAPGANRTRVREAVDIHLLAVSAWRAKSLDQKDAWEAVGLDPSIDLCPPLRLVADFTAQPESVSRAQARGAAVAGALPLLWECANERIAALEQTLAGR